MGEVARVTVHGHTYELTLSTSAAADALELEVAQPSSGELWAGSFDAHCKLWHPTHAPRAMPSGQESHSRAASPPYGTDVEEITQRAGSFKKFAVFLQMLRSALQAGGSVSLDILTYADLQALKRRRAGQPDAGSSAGAVSTNNKRYIILTYESQFDRCARPSRIMQPSL